MIGDIRIPIPIQWHEGMLLSPQHMQLSDFRTHQMVKAHWLLAGNDHFGIINLTIDKIMLAGGKIRVTAMDALFPDGMMFHYDIDTHNQVHPIELDLTYLKQQAQNAVPVRSETVIYVALPMYDRTSNVVGEFPRFISVEGEDIRDQNSPDNTIRIPRLFPKVFLCDRDHIPPKATAFALLKICFEDENYMLMPFTPPCMSLDRGGHLFKAALDLVHTMRRKISLLAEKWQHEYGTPMLQETSEMMRPLHMALPEIEAFLSGSHITPSKLHEVLCRTMGALLPLKINAVPPVPPPYNHQDIDGSVMPVIEVCKSLIPGVEHDYLSLAFQRQDRRFYLKLHVQLAGKTMYLGVRAGKGMSERMLEEWMKDAIIASDGMLEEAITKRITGAKRRLLSQREAMELMPNRGVAVYELGAADRFIVFDQNLNVINPADSPDNRPAEVVLYQKKI